MPAEPGPPPILDATIPGSGPADRAWLPSVLLLLGGLALALGLTAVALTVPRTYVLDLGAHPGTPLLRGFYRRPTADGTLWTNGNGLILLSPTGIGLARTRVRIVVAGHPARPNDQAQVVMNGYWASTFTVRPDLQSIVVQGPPSRDAGECTLIIRSSTTSGSAPGPLGVRVGSVAVETGGLAALRGVGTSTFGLVLIVVLAGVVAGYWAPVRRPPSTRQRTARAMIGGVGLAAVFVAFKFEFLPLLAKLALGAALASGYLVLAGHPALASPLSRASHRMAAWTMRPAWFACLAVGLLVGLLPGAVFAGRVLSQADILYMHYPWAAHAPAGFAGPGNPLMGDIPMFVYPSLVHAADAVRHWRFPLWSAAIYAGHPFFASYQSAVLSPFTAVAYLVPLPQATAVIAALRLLVGGLGMFVFVRSIGLRWPAAVVAGTAYLLNPFSLVWLEHPLSAVVAWLPWLLWATERVAVRMRPGALAWLGLTVGLVLLAGHPETALKVIILGGCYGIARSIGQPQRWRAITMMAVGYGAGLLLAAIQILPFYEYLRLSPNLAPRINAPLNPYVLSPATLITALVPDFYGTPIRNSYFGPSNYCEQQVYAGIATWVLVAVGCVARWRDRRVLFFAASGLTAGLIMYGTPGILDVVSSIPVLRLAALSRFGLVVIACASVLAAFGVEALTAQADPNSANLRGGLWLPALVVAVLAAGTIVFRFSGLPKGAPVDAIRVACLWAGALLAGTCGVVWLRARRGLPLVLFVAGILMLTLVDLIAFGRDFHPQIPAEQVFPRLPEIDAIKADPGVFRVTGYSTFFLPDAAAAYGLQDVRGYDAVSLGYYSELLDAALELKGGFHYALALGDPRLLDLLNVKYLFVAPDQKLPEGRYTKLDFGPAPVYRNNRAFPRTFLVDGYLVKTGNAARRILRDGSVNMRRVVLLGADLPLAERPDATGPGEQPGEARVTRYEDMRVEIETRSVGRRLLVLSDVDYPGWQATIDGHPAPIHRANYAFRAVSVGAGRHVVGFQYVPFSFAAGATISGLTALALVGLVLFERRRAARDAAR